jgi:iron complex transport system permease protein
LTFAVEAARERGLAASSRLLLALATLALAAGLASVCVGPSKLSPFALLNSLHTGGDPMVRAVLLELRLPRAVLALMVGAILGLAGATLQGYLRNPLADPAVLGVSNAAALGAVAALYFGLTLIQPALLPLAAIVGALAALLPLVWLTRRSEGPLGLILAGTAEGALDGAGVSLALNLSPNPFAAGEIMSWLLGSLADRDVGHIWLAGPCIAAGGALLLWDARALDVLSLGEDAARSMGTELGPVRLRLLVGVALGVGGAVAVSGAIGFVGLVTPHLVRPFTDRRPSSVLAPSALAGAALLALADVLVRMIPTPTELKLGVLTAALGVPVFLVQLARTRASW